MKRVSRFLGWLLIALALVVAGWELAVFFDSGSYHTLTLGEVWARIDLPSLSLTQAALERHVWPPLWDPVLLTVLKAPAWVTLAVLGLLLAWAGHERRKRGFFKR